MNNNDERDYAEEQANRQAFEANDEGWHCFRCVESEPDADDAECVHCDCCCQCLGCEYGPRDGMQLTAEQRAPIAELAADYAAPNAGSTS